MHHIVDLPPLFDPDKHDAGHLHAYLVDLGYDIEGVSVTDTHVIVYEPEQASSKTTTVGTSSEHNQLAEDVAAFVPPRSEREELLDELHALDLESGDVETLRQAVMILTQIVTLR